MPDDMFILFALIVMRMTGAMVFNSLFGSSHVPGTVRGALVFFLSLLLYTWTGGYLAAEPVGMLDFVIMLLKELLVGFAMGFGMELTTMIIRYASTLIDYSMGLSMAQMYDPFSGTQMSVSVMLFYTTMMLLFFAKDGHLRYLEIVFESANRIPFGQVQITQELPRYILQYFEQCIVLGVQIAMPVLGVELVCEFLIGILMRVIPQINIFVVSFAVKILVGLILILILFNPIASKMDTIWQNMFDALYDIVGLMG